MNLSSNYTMSANSPFVQESPGIQYPPIEESIDMDQPYQTVTQRYFTPRYYMGTDGREGEDHCILFHSNRICLVTLAPSHPVLRDKKKVEKVNFQVTTKLDRMSNKVSGKGKHGAQFLQSSSPLCIVECSDGTKYTVQSCLDGKLVEMNDALIENPNLLVEKPDAEGFIAIVLPKITKSEQRKSELLNAEEYHATVGGKLAQGAVG